MTAAGRTASGLTLLVALSLLLPLIPLPSALSLALPGLVLVALSLPLLWLVLIALSLGLLSLRLAAALLGLTSTTLWLLVTLAALLGLSLAALLRLPLTTLTGLPLVTLSGLSLALTALALARLALVVPWLSLTALRLALTALLPLIASVVLVTLLVPLFVVRSGFPVPLQRSAAVRTRDGPALEFGSAVRTVRHAVCTSVTPSIKTPDSSIRSDTFRATTRVPISDPK